MEIINGTKLSELCDYSFGDHLGGVSSQYLPGGFMKEANVNNLEFLEKCKEFEGRIMTLFIDNIRLYPRSLAVNQMDVEWVTHLINTNNLLGVCASLKNNKFVIFCSHEDTPINDEINVPDNVLGIHAVNAEYNNDKIHPFPYGLQREIQRGDYLDERLKIMKRLVEEDKHQEPTKLLYINCGLGTERNDKERVYLPNFEGLSWATCRFDKDSKYFTYDKYEDFLTELRDHKFMICPKGHGLDCHRNWESLYLRRVPVMKDDPYFRLLMKGFPVLFVKDWPEVTQELLIKNDKLYQEALTMNLNKLDLNLIFNGIVNSYG